MLGDNYFGLKYTVDLRPGYELKLTGKIKLFLFNADKTRLTNQVLIFKFNEPF